MVARICKRKSWSCDIASFGPDSLSTKTSPSALFRGIALCLWLVVTCGGMRKRSPEPLHYVDVHPIRRHLKLYCDSRYDMSYFDFRLKTGISINIVTNRGVL